MLATVRRDYSKKPLLVAVFVMTVAFLLYMMSHSIASALLSISEMSRVPLRYDVVEERSYIFPKDDYPGRDALDELINSNNVLDEQRMRSLEKAEQRLPNALIIGAKKCGTGALREMLDLHPAIQIVPNEIHFFDNFYNNGLEWYRQQMPFSFENQITIEKSPRYFVTPEAPARIKSMDADIKLLLIVRDPVVRVISDYAFALARGETDQPFEKLVLHPNGEINEQYVPVQVSKFVTHMHNYLKFFPREQIHVVDGDALVRNPYLELIKVEKFLGLPAKIRSDNFYFSETKGFYCMRSGPHKGCLGKGKGRKHPDVDPNIIKTLRRYYAPYNEQFYKLVGQNFNWPTS